mgnify:CR=1 FL=1
MIDLEGGPCVAKRLSGCGSGTEYLAVAPWGDLYPCHQFVGNEAFCMGNVLIPAFGKLLKLGNNHIIAAAAAAKRAHLIVYFLTAVYA